MKRETSEFGKRRAWLYDLMDKSPAGAIDAARMLNADSIMAEVNILILKGCVFLDAGTVLKDAKVISEGIEIFRDLRKRYPARFDVAYNLANGLVAAADLITYEDPSWFLRTRQTRLEARRLFGEAASNNDVSKEIEARSLTNLGNALLRAYRFVETYDLYMKAIEADPTNGVALTGAAKILLRFANLGIGDRGMLLAAAKHHLDTARLHKDKLKELAGPHAHEQLSPLLSSNISGGEMPKLDSADEYTKFVAKYRLALSPTLAGLDASVQRWDTLNISSITESLKESGVPPVFAMFNVLKSDYLVTRYLAFIASSGQYHETGRYFDTLDYAVYGLGSSLLTLAQRACYDLLDKIAVATSHCFNLPGKPEEIKFGTRWSSRDPDGNLVWQPQIAQEIGAGNTAFVALSEIAYDLRSGGFLHEKKILRHSSTHRFIVLHDMGNEPSRHCKSIHHCNESRFFGDLLETMRLARAAMFYFLEAVSLRESRLTSNDAKHAHLFVYDHDWIRGRSTNST